MNLMSHLFDQPYAGQWVSPGDQRLWQEMRQHFLTNHTTVPKDMDRLHVILQGTFQALTRHHLAEEEAFYEQRFDPDNNIAAGYITPTWWYNTGIPILIDRAARNVVP